MLTICQCHTHPKVKDGPKRRRETQAGRARAVSSASATSSSYPVKQEMSQTDTMSHRHSTPAPMTGTSSLFGMQNTTASVSGVTSTPTATPNLSTASYPSNTAYPTPTSATPTMDHLQTPTATSFADAQRVKTQPIVGMFTTPLQSTSSFQSYSHAPNLAHQVSEPELVGIRTTTTTLNSIASMI